MNHQRKKNDTMSELPETQGRRKVCPSESEAQEHSTSGSDPQGHRKQGVPVQWNLQQELNALSTSLLKASEKIKKFADMFEGNYRVVVVDDTGKIEKAIQLLEEHGILYACDFEKKLNIKTRKLRDSFIQKLVDIDPSIQITREQTHPYRIVLVKKNRRK